MYSVFLSKIEEGIEVVSIKLKEYIKENSKFLILPWAFPEELNAEKLDNEYFKTGGTKYNKYIDSLKKIGIYEKDIIIGNCYSDNKEKLKQYIKDSDIILIPGGNPEMLFGKIVHNTELLYDIKHYKGIIIGESAGAIIQQKRYFITERNNYYKYFAFYDGLGVIEDPFYIDVHSSNDFEYTKKLQEIAYESSKDIYGIFDNGAIIYNRISNGIECFGNVNCFNQKSYINYK